MPYFDRRCRPGAALCTFGLLFSMALGTSVPARAQQSSLPPVPVPVPVPVQALYPLGRLIPAPHVTIDVSDAPEDRAWAEEARTLVQQWFPLVCDFLATEHYHPPKTLTLVFKDHMDGVAYTTGMGSSAAETVISGKWIAAHPDDFGMVIHEMTHVIQGYPDREYAAASWLVEGMADYIRFYRYEPDFPRNQVQPRDPQKATYHDGYRTTAAFLAYVTWKYDRGLVSQLDQALRDDAYSDSLWTTLTG
jgi:hypothetical protein